MPQRKYIDNPENVEILSKADAVLREIYMNIPEDQLQGVQMTVNADTLLLITELLLAYAETYEAFVPPAPMCADCNTSITQH